MPLFSGLVLFAAVTLESPSAARCRTLRHPSGSVRKEVERACRPAFQGVPDGIDLYSLRARRRLASLLRLRLLELRKADLERVSRSLEQHLEGLDGPAPPTLRW
jgi:hypothetical protein